MSDPSQIFAQYEGKLAEAQRKSEDIRSGLADLRVTERSTDGQIVVSVNSSGNLVDIQLGDSLQRREPSSVGPDILRAVQAAQNRVAGALREAMNPMLGDSAAMDFMIGQVRSAQPPPPPEYVAGGGGYVSPEQRSAFDTRSYEDTPPPVPPRPQARHRSVDDGEDFDDHGFLR